MFGKKGMSPLIATILLMAFAVALGAVIMNWSTQLPDGGPDCSEVKLAIKSFCTADGTLSINMRNVGSKAIEQISFSIEDPPIVVPKLSISDSRLGNGETLIKQIPFGFGNTAKVSIIPIVQDHGESVSCSEPVHVMDSLPSC